MSDFVYFEDLAMGDRFVSQSHRITADDVSRFAQLTGDFNPLHLDADYASESPFGRPIAHGLLGLSFVAGLASAAPKLDTVALLGVTGWRFLHPVYYGDLLHVDSEVTELEPNGRKRGRVVWNRKLINQHNWVVQEGNFETLVARRLAAQPCPLPVSITESVRRAV